MEESNSIERLKKRLYSRTDSVGIKERAPLPLRGVNAPHSFPASEEAPAPAPRMESHFPLSAVLWGSFFFFIGSVAIAGFIFLRGGNVVSSGNITLEVVGPSLVDGGKQATLQVLIKNGNQVPLELSDLIVSYPEGTRRADDVTAALPEIRESLGTIEAGQQVKRSVSAILFGEEGALRHIDVSLEYRVQGSNAVFVKEGGIDLTIGSSPVTLFVDASDEATAGREVSFTLTVASNAQAPVRGVVLKADYPFGFSVTEVSPETAIGDNLWQLGELRPREERVLRVRGILEAQDNEERVFRFAVGSQKGESDLTLAVPFVTIPHTLTVRRTFISGTLALEGNQNRTVSVAAGREIAGTISWQNNLDAEVYDVELRAVFQGEALDRTKLSAPQGFYRSADSSILWNGDTDPGLRVVAPGATGSYSFTFVPRNTNTAGTLLKNPELSIAVEARARRITGENVPTDPVSLATRRVLVSSPIVLEAATSRFSGPFQNQGPLPPRVNQESTYTVTWTVRNPSNAVANAKVSATLPATARFLGSSPSSERISFNPTNNMVVWDIGELLAGGVASSRKVSFQIGFTPSLSQVGSVPSIVGPAQLTGDDRFAQTKVSAEASAVTTRVVGEPGFTPGMEAVVE